MNNIVSLMVVFIFTFASTASANGPDLAVQVAELQKQMMVMQETMKLQQETIQKLATQIAGGKEVSAQEGPIHIPTEKEWQARTAPWLEGLTYDGSFRLRYEAFDQSPNRADRNRFRGALNFGLKKGLGKDFLVGFRLGTGEPNTTNGSEGLNVDPTCRLPSFT